MPLDSAMHVRSSGASVTTSVRATSASLLSSGSGSFAAAAAAFTATPGSVVSTMTCFVDEASALMLPIVQDTMRSLAEYEQPGEADTNSALSGIASAITAPVARSGPLFVTTIV